jgi:hypothetical protein
MVTRLALLVIGVLEALFPRRMVDFWMRRAAKGGEEVALKEWVYKIARIEGIVIVLWVLTRRGRSRGEE